MELRINLRKLLISISIVLVCLVCVFTAFGQNSTDPVVREQAKIFEYWPYIALVVSEVLAFLPQKVSGIAQAVFSVLNSLFTKKKSN